ncbi:DUF4097 family beta strand repeat-containing protein [Marinilabilia salmonicolor]|uniref:DUF4097 family beta strand repeat-containing protein n=1 Tax=Marinilabilia salmonicolor TaxID=989 RepID=UPI0004695A91|nr:DUF4097 family beta strand repeat-containing protein [Marinilabilia salmonicolor]
MKHFLSLSIMLFLLAGCQMAGAQQLADQMDERFSGVQSIQVKGVFCDVSVNAGTSDEVHLTGEIRVTRGIDDYGIKTSREGNLLKVWVEHPNMMRGIARGFLSFDAPEGVMLSIENVSGNVEVLNIKSDDMSLAAVSGDIKVLGAGNGCRLKSVSGEIEATLINGHLKANSVSGDIRVADVKGDFNGNCTSGSISARMIEGNVSLGSTSGDLALESLMNGALAKTTSGSIQVNMLKGNLHCETVSGSIKLKDVTGSLKLASISGSQEGTGIMFAGDSNFRSVSGDIEMDVLNEIESLSFKLRSNSGRLMAGNSAADDRLEIAGGGILVTGSSTSGNQIFK